MKIPWTMEKKLKKYEESKNGCWEYTGYIDNNGYGSMSHGKLRMLPAHRCSYEFHIGTIPDNMNISHDCNNRKCINPKHLFLSPRNTITTEILSRYEINENGCWNWTGFKNNKGYGICSNARGNRLVHRLSFEFYVSKIEKGLFVCHKCDNPSCINPEHLFVGTQQDNMDDMAKKGRNLFGSKHQNSKLNENDVFLIREMKLSGKKAKEISDIFEVSINTIYDVISRRCWKHI